MLKEVVPQLRCGHSLPHSRKAYGQGGRRWSGTIDGGGLDVVLVAANGTMTDSGGTEVLADGGTASGTTVNIGGIEVVASGGTACGMIVNSGGIDAWSAAGLRVAPRWTTLA